MKVHNVQNVSDISLRNIYQKASADSQNLSMGNPRVTSLNIKNLYNRFRQAPTSLIKLLKPTVLSLALRNLYNKLDTQRDSFTIGLPSITFIEVRPLLQKLRTWGLDETLEITLPNSIEIYKKDVVNLYDNKDIIEFKVDTPEPLEVEVKNILNKFTQLGPSFEVGLPNGIEVDGTVKPALSFPVLEGEIINDVLIGLTWDDSSITHTGYTIYRSLEPIPVDTTQEPYIQLGRDVKQFDDLSVDENTTYYYRVTPKSVYGNLFSNLLSLHVPPYLRAPRSFEVGYQSLSQAVNGVGGIQSLTKILTMNSRYLSTNKISSISGEYAYQIFMTEPEHHLVKVESPYKIAGFSKLDQVLRNAKASFASLENPTNPYTEFFNEIELRNVSTRYVDIKEPENIETRFAGITKSFIRGAFVILGAAIENRSGNYDSITETQNIVGLGTREMMLRNPEAYLLIDGRIEAIVGIYTDDISLKTGEYRYIAEGEISDVEQSYYNPTTVIDPVYSYYPVNKATGWGEYREEITVRNVDYLFTDFRTEDLTASLFSLTVVGNTQAYCTLGSDASGLVCRYVKEPSPYDILPQVTTLDIPRNIRTSVEEDQVFTLFSGYLPPVGYHLAYDTYRIGSSVIPVFRSQAIPGDATRFTIYERMFKSKEVTSGYTPPNGVGIRFSLFVDED